VSAVSILGENRHHTHSFKGLRLSYGFTISFCVCVRARAYVIFFFSNEGTGKRSVEFNNRIEFEMEMKPCTCGVQTKQFRYRERGDFSQMSLVHISRAVVEESTTVNDFNI